MSAWKIVEPSSEELGEEMDRLRLGGLESLGYTDAELADMRPKGVI